MGQVNFGRFYLGKCFNANDKTELLGLHRQSLR